MPRYRTEIVVSRDRYVCLQLPEDFPEGPATITLYALDPGTTPRAETPDDPAAEPPDPDDEGDVEWWDEFDERPGP